MITALDTNVVVALMVPTLEVTERARKALTAAASAGRLLICAPVYCELVAAPGRDVRFMETFLEEAGIAIDWTLSEQVWREASGAFRRYAVRRRGQKQPGPRRILADFVIGAHALLHSDGLLTLDRGMFRAAFPHLRISAV